MKKEKRLFNLFQKLLSFIMLMFSVAFVTLNANEYLVNRQLIFQKEHFLRYYIAFLFGLFLLSVFRHFLLLFSGRKTKIGGHKYEIY